MTSFMVDGRFATSPHAFAAGSEAIGLWVICGSWAAAHLTDGFVPAKVAHDYASPAAAKRLVDCGLWDADPDGYWFSLSTPIRYWQIEREQDNRRRIPQHVRSAVLKRDGHACLHCGATEDLTMDHIYPWSLGGPDKPDNLQTLCRPCNSRKGAKV